jgi:putative phosphoribosyl transferase
VPVAYEVARRLGAALDILVVRKLGFPGQEELALGAIASGGVRVLNADVVKAGGLSAETIDSIAEREQAELDRREKAYRGERPLPSLDGKAVILVDDGLATGATMRAAIQAVRAQNAAEVVVAVPVAPAATVASLQQSTDALVCLETPEMFLGIGQWYDDFSQTTDEEVRERLRTSWKDYVAAEVSSDS